MDCETYSSLPPLFPLRIVDPNSVYLMHVRVILGLCSTIGERTVQESHGALGWKRQALDHEALVVHCDVIGLHVEFA
ncbi:hypothetical protein V6N13_096158 [Hibiscus sabdariffa]